MRSAVVLTSLVVLMVAAPARGRAQPVDVQNLAGRPIASMAVEEEQRVVTAADVLALIETRVGAPLSMADVRESVLHLSSIGRFDRVEVDARPERAGVGLVYRLVATRRVTHVDFHGTLGVSRRRLRQALGSRGLGVPTDDRRRAAERALRSIYDSLGYFDATVHSAVDDRPDPRRSRLVFTIDAGTRERIGELTVTGEGLAAPEVLARLDLRSGVAWDAPSLERRTQRMVAMLRDRGHYEASVTWSTRRRGTTGLLDVTVDVRTGPRVELVFDSPDVPVRRLREFVPVAREGAVDEDLLEDSKRRIESWLHGQGHARATATYERTELTDRLQVTVHVRRGPLYQVEQIEIDGVDASRRTEVEARLQIQRGQPFSETALAQSAAAITQYYQVQGFASARVDAQANLPPESAVSDRAGTLLMRPRLVVTEGEQTLVGRVSINGSTLPESELRALMVVKAGTPFYAAQLLADRNAVSAYYLNRGYRESRVDVIPQPSEQPGALDVTYEITEGTRFVIGHVLIAGNTRTSTSTITRELGLDPGMPLGTKDLTDAQRRLTALGLFRRVTVDELPQPGRRATDVTIGVDEAPATNIGYGIGLEVGRRLVRSTDSEVAVEKLEFAPRGFFEVGRRNLWGKNRSVNLFTRFSLRDRGGSNTTATEDDTPFYEFRVVGTYREPRVFGTRADAQVNGVVEQGVRSSFNFGRQGVNAEMARRYGSQVTLLGRYSFGKTKLFDQRLAPDEKPLIDRLFPQLRLSTVASVIVQDTRNEPLDPSDGHVASFEGDLSARALGSEVGFVKGFAQGFLYRRVPGTRSLIFAGGARLGLATSFGVQVQTEAGQSVTVEVKDLPASERFYAGGSTTVRGYALDRLGDDATIDSDGFPRGGNALVILNAELRFPVWRSFGGVAFLDAGNVFARAMDFDLGRIKGSAGGGLRYRSPIGPIRVDVGLKFDPHQLADGSAERRWEVHISLGQAF